jgi:hypothetical protein
MYFAAVTFLAWYFVCRRLLHRDKAWVMWSLVHHTHCILVRIKDLRDQCIPLYFCFLQATVVYIQLQYNGETKEILLCEIVCCGILYLIYGYSFTTVDLSFLITKSLINQVLACRDSIADSWYLHKVWSNRSPTANRHLYN